MLETWDRIPREWAFQFKKSQIAVSTTERYFTLCGLSHSKFARRQRKQHAIKHALIE